MNRPSAALLTLILAACGTGQSGATGAADASQVVPSASATTEAPDPLFVLRTPTGCAATPASIARVASGQNTWDLRNGGPERVNFELLRVNWSYAEIVAWFIETQADIAAGADPPDSLPFIEDELERVLVPAGETGSMTADLTPGEYAIVCVVVDEGDQIITAYPAGPFSVPE